MSEEMVDVDVTLDRETAERIKKMTKSELINDLCVSTLRNYVQDETVARLEREASKLRRDNRALETKLDKAEAYVEQGRAMIKAVMERWYEYDV